MYFEGVTCNLNNVYIFAYECNVCFRFLYEYKSILIPYICAGQQLQQLQTLHIGVNGVCEQGMNDFSHQKERFHREVRGT